MNDRISFIRLPILLLVLFFLGKLIVGAAGGDYSLGTRLFAMVPLTVHLCLIWGALSRSLRATGAGSAALTGVLIALVAQILIVVGTLGSYILGVDTHFSSPVAIVGVDRAVGFGEAAFARVFGLLVNCVIGAVAASLGWALGGLVPGGGAAGRGVGP